MSVFLPKEMPKKFTKFKIKKLCVQNPRECGAANGEPRIGEGVLYINPDDLGVFLSADLDR